MIDSTNPRQLADNIRKLWDKFKSISGDLLPSRSTATTGQILKLTGETKTPAWADEYSYTPPAYSETEVNTGKKWIDGKDVYCKVLYNQFPVITTTSNQAIGTLTYDSVIDVGFIVTNNSGFFGRLNNNISISSGNITVSGVSATYSEYYYISIIYYTKPDPAPETRDDDTPEEPEAKKTRKKTTK